MMGIPNSAVTPKWGWDRRNTKLVLADPKMGPKMEVGRWESQIVFIDPKMGPQNGDGTEGIPNSAL